MYCRFCGKELSDDSRFCPYCGKEQLEVVRSVQSEQNNFGIVCPNCGERNVSVQIIPENTGGTTVTKTTTRIRSSNHGCLWWILIGWWWWLFDLLIWIFAFIPRLIWGMTKKRKRAFSTSVARTVNNTTFHKTCVCQNCGYSWTIRD